MGMKGIGTKLGYALGVLTIALPARAFAAVAGGGVLPWDAPLNTLQTDLQGPVAHAVMHYAACPVAVVPHP